MSGVSDGDYEHACRVWREFGIQNMGEYHDLYLRTDVVLLVNVFESFRRVCLENCGLDQSHFSVSSNRNDFNFASKIFTVKEFSAHLKIEPIYVSVNLKPDHPPPGQNPRAIF